MFDKTLDGDVARLLASTGKTLSIAETVTGGLLATRLTQAEDSRAYFLGGIVCESVLIQLRLCHVSVATLKQYGAASVHTAKEMAKGVRDLMKSDMAIAVVGSVESPSSDTHVGTVYMALVNQSSLERAEARQVVGDRDTIRHQCVQTALFVLRQWLDMDVQSIYEQKKEITLDE